MRYNRNMKPQRGREILAQSQQALNLSDQELLNLQMEVDNATHPTAEALSALGFLAFELGQRDMAADPTVEIEVRQ